MVRIIYMAKETYSSIESLKFLLTLSEIEIVRAVIRKSDECLRGLCKDHNIPMCSEEELLIDYKTGCLRADYIFSYYWKRAKKETLQIPINGAINFHPGPLPEARGSGYHVAILENWGYYGVTAHYMEEEFDTGNIIECRRFPIETGIINKDLVRLTHEKLYLLFHDIVLQIASGGGHLTRHSAASWALFQSA